jgi:hypothetical protein
MLIEQNFYAIDGREDQRHARFAGQLRQRVLARFCQRIPLVRRSDYIALDRGKLAYLNGIEKANCNYCGYANGLLAYIREVTARTEQYWCPIKHARRVKGAHPHYRAFVDYGDAEGYKKELPVLRKTLRQHK